MQASYSRLTQQEESQSTHTAHGDQRKQDIVLATYSLIAEGGLERLRTRDIAARAHMSIATLHYYFGTKEDVIRGVVDYLLHEFMYNHSPRSSSNASPLDLLRFQFEDLQYRLREKPEMSIVLHELYLRSLRDPAISNILCTLETHWRLYLEKVFEQGIQQGYFRSDLNISATTTIFMAFIRGITYAIPFPPQQQHFSILCQELERWLTE